MNMNKKILLLFIIYIVGIVGFAGYKASKGGETYFSYKSEVKKAKAQLDGESKEDKNQQSIENSANDKDKKSEEANNAAQAANSSTSQPAAATDTKKEEDYATVSFSRTLTQGFTGEDVKKLQYLLQKKSNYTGAINGKFEKTTFDALKKFQSDNKLKVDGQLGPDTWKRLEQK